MKTNHLQKMYFHSYVLTIIFIVQPIFSLECSIQGKCIFSDQITTVTVSSTDECLVRCAIDSKCNFSTYNSVNFDCLLFTNCLEVDNSFIEDWTNEKECVNRK